MGSENIGPTECNQNRLERTKAVNELWDKCLRTNSEVFGTHRIFERSLDLCREAMSCYQNGAYMAACVMCRAALDTAIYDMLSRPYEKNIIPVGEGYKINLEYVDLGYNEIKDAVKVKYDLGDGIFKKMKDLRGPGHFAAHYGQQQDKLIKEYSGIEGLIDTRGLKLWSDSTEAIILIENSFKILLLLIDKAKDEICLNNLRTMFKPVWYRDFNSRSLR